MTDPITTTERVAARVRGAMAEKRVTQAELGKALGLGQTSVTSRMSGEVRWSVREIYLAAQHLQVAVADLVPDLLGFMAEQMQVPESVILGTVDRVRGTL